MTDNFFAPKTTGSTVKFPAPGSSFMGMISGDVTMKQATVYNSNGVLDFWDKEQTRPKMEAVIPMKDQQGTDWRLFVTDSSAQQKAIATALQVAGVTFMSTGGFLTVTFTHTIPGKAPGTTKKEYSAVYQPAA